MTPFLHPRSQCRHPLLIWRKNKFVLCCVFYWFITRYISTKKRAKRKNFGTRIVCVLLWLSFLLTKSEPFDGFLLLPLFFLMTFHCQLGTRSQRQHGKCAGCDTFSLPLSQRARESHQSLTRPRSRRGNANMGKILCTFHHFPFVGIFEESVPIMQVAWTQSGQIINQCWEIKEKRKERNTAGNEKIGVTSLGRLFSICKLGGKCRCQRKCLNTRTPHTGNINISVIYTVTLQLPPALPCLMRTSG